MKIAWLRKKKSLTQAALAIASGATQQQIALIEKGMVDPRLSTLFKIAAALDTDIQGLFFSPKEFVETLNSILQKDHLKRSISLLELNVFCGEKYHISPFDSNWALVDLNEKNKIVLKKGCVV